MRDKIDIKGTSISVEYKYPEQKIDPVLQIQCLKQQSMRVNEAQCDREYFKLFLPPIISKMDNIFKTIVIKRFYCRYDPLN